MLLTMELWGTGKKRILSGNFVTTHESHEAHFVSHTWDYAPNAHASGLKIDSPHRNTLGWCVTEPIERRPRRSWARWRLAPTNHHDTQVNYGSSMCRSWRRITLTHLVPTRHLKSHKSETSADERVFGLDTNLQHHEDTLPRSQPSRSNSLRLLWLCF